MAVSGSGHLRSGIDVGLRNERIERDGQQHDAQQKCAPRRSREATGLCSLFPRQQLNIQLSDAAAGGCLIAHSLLADQHAPAQCKGAAP